jgi:hypothetical protein
MSQEWLSLEDEKYLGSPLKMFKDVKNLNLVKNPKKDY